MQQVCAGAASSQTRVVAVTITDRLRKLKIRVPVYPNSLPLPIVCLLFIFSMVVSLIKKVKWPFCYLPLFPPFPTKIHNCTHALTHARSHTHSLGYTCPQHTHSPDFRHVGESQAMPGQTLLRWAKEQNTHFCFPRLALQNGCQAYHKAPCSAQFLFSSAVVLSCSHLIG